MRHVIHLLRDIGGQALRRYTDRRRRGHEPHGAGVREAQVMFDYDGRDDPC